MMLFFSRCFLKIQTVRPALPDAAQEWLHALSVCCMAIVPCDAMYIEAIVRYLFTESLHPT